MPYNVQKASQKLTVGRLTTGTCFDRTGALIVRPAGALRLDHDPLTLEFLGALSEPSATNRLLNSAVLVGQTVTVTAVQHVLSFFGTGTVTLSGAHTANLVGLGALLRQSLVFTPSAGPLLLAVSGDVRMAQIEVGGRVTSYIPTLGAQVTRAADALSLALPPGTFAGSLILDNGVVVPLTALSGTYAIPNNLARRHIRRFSLRP